jgi:hypothetical protein
MKIISLTQGKVAIVSDVDYAYLKQWKWCYSKLNHGKGGYAVRGAWRDGRTQTVKMHRIVAERAGKLTQGDVDHCNQNKLDNRRSNLRSATRPQTLGNQGLRSDNTTGYRGVSPYRNGWQAGIRVGGKRQHLGHFKSKRAAARAYNKRAIEVFGKFAVLNKI